MLNDFASVYRTLLIEKDKSTRYLILGNYLDKASDSDQWMAIRLFYGYKSKSLVNRNELLSWIIEFSSLPDWLIQQCYSAVGDWAETFSLIIGNPNITSSGLGLSEFLNHLEQVRSKIELKIFLQFMWKCLSPTELFLFHKLISGNYKSIKENNFFTGFISEKYQIDSALIEIRLNQLSGSSGSFSELVKPTWSEEEILAQLYPFYLPIVLEQDYSSLYESQMWIAEPYESGLRIQWIRRDDATYLWTDHNQLLPLSNLKFIDLNILPSGTVLDGIIQSATSINSNSNLQSEENNEGDLQFKVIDILEWNSQDIRNTPMIERKKILSHLIDQLNNSFILPVYYQEVEDWRKPDIHAFPNGWILKKKTGRYHPGQEDWFRIKSRKKEIHAMLMYAEAIPRQSQGYLCTFGVYNEEKVLVPIVKLSTETLGEAMLTQLHYWIQNNIVQKFGPVRVVRSHQVFVIDFDKVIKNKRLKAGLTLKNAQIKKWVTSITADYKIDLLENLKTMD